MYKNELIEILEKAIRWSLRNKEDYVIMSNPNNDDEPYYITRFHRSEDFKTFPNFVMTVDYPKICTKSPVEALELVLTDSN